MILALFPRHWPSSRPRSRRASPSTPSYRALARCGSPDRVMKRRRRRAHRLHFAEMDAQTERRERRRCIIRLGRRLDRRDRATSWRSATSSTPIGTIRSRRGSRSAPCVTASTHADVALALRRPPAPRAIDRAGGRCSEDVFARASPLSAASTRDDLLLAWDFTTASTQALTDWIVSVRDQAFALGTPTFTVDERRRRPRRHGPQREHLRRASRARSRRRSS